MIQEKRDKKTGGLKGVPDTLKLRLRRKGLLVAACILAGILVWCFHPVGLFHASYSVVILDRNGELIGASIATDGQWRFPPQEKLPEKFIDAITLFEDHRFFYHPGVDPLAVIRAVVSNFRARKIVSGASTLTMQVVRLSRETPSRTLREKILEMILAFRLELTRSKEEILALYAAHAPFGGNVVGLEAASWRYFARRPDQLTWAESAMLAVLPNSPSLVHPGKSRGILLEKRNRLLDRLESTHVIDGLTCSLAKAEPLPSAPHPLPMLAPHLLSRIIQEKMGTPAVRKPGKKGEVLPGSPADIPAEINNRNRFLTSLEKTLQDRVTGIVRSHHRHLAGNGIYNAAALVLDVETNEVLAYVGNIPDFSDSEHGNFVDVVTAPRSTGSILKPFLYAAMLESGELLPSELVPDIPTRIGSFVPQNYTRTYEGAVPANMALARSMNVPAVRMLQSYGVDRFYKVLKELGMSTLHRTASGYGLTLILGGAEGTLWDITGMYGGLARTVNRHFSDPTDGTPAFSRPRYLLSQEPDYEVTGNTFLGPAASWLTLQSILEVSRPDEDRTWRNFSSSHRIAWKTGTSYGLRDGWAVGVTPRYAVGVWVGNADGEGRPGLTGISTAAPILFEIFGILDHGDWFEIPESELAEIDVCAFSGHRKGPYCAETRSLYVPLAGLKSRSCPYCRIVQCDRDLKWRVHGSCERIGRVRQENWFVLPPVLEWFYQSRHLDYKPLPQYRSDCLESAAAVETPSISLIYPRESGEIYVPVELDGTRGRTVFEAVHRNPDLQIYWHLDEEYLGVTRDIHQMALDPDPGIHVLTLVDENGEQMDQTFKVLTQIK
ncbi:MAG: penicillin-binding protein 1C [Acidobacteriota bacterium]